MVADTENKRGRPCIHPDFLYAIFNDREKRSAQNMYYAGAATTLLNQQPGDFFITDKGNYRRQGIAEQIGRMYKQDGYLESDCKKVYEMALDLYTRGYKVKTIEKWIRHGRTTGEW